MQGLMDVLPDAVVQHVLCFITNAKDVAACSCVCKRWNELMVHVPRLCFGRNVGDKVRQPELIATRMVLNMVALKELVVYCPFSTVSLLAWLSHTKSSLKVLELRVDKSGEDTTKSSVNKLDCITSSLHLQTLRLWGGFLSQCPPGWRSFRHLHILEIVGARIRDPAIRGILLSCPALRELALLGCDGVRFVSIELDYLEKCRLDFCGSNIDCCVSILSPKLQRLEVQGASCLRILEDCSLRHLTVAKHAGKMNKLEVGKLPVLESLSLRGLQWSWDAVQRALLSATEVQELFMRIEFCGDGDTYEPFPEVDFVEFFSNHQKLRTFEVHGAMFAALSHKTQLSANTLVPSLEEAYITIRSPLNGERKLQVLESLIKCSPALKKLVLRVTQMKNNEVEADEFFFKLLALNLRYSFITVE